jgi:hypothetical protein
MGAVEVDLPAGIQLTNNLNALAHIQGDPVGSAQFDPDEGFPTKVQYADLQAATRNFGDSHKIGDGGSCVVYKAELYGVPCAIKLLSQNASAWEEKQFAAEINVLTHIKHDNICQLYACSTDGANRCLVLELMDTSLVGRVSADPSLGWEQRTYILVCVCRGLVHLHSQSPPMIHRDVKSDNGKGPPLLQSSVLSCIDAPLIYHACFCTSTPQCCFLAS